MLHPTESVTESLGEGQTRRRKSLAPRQYSATKVGERNTRRKEVITEKQLITQYFLDQIHQLTVGK